jgi:hypothetical protein
MVIVSSVLLTSDLLPLKSYLTCISLMTPCKALSTDVISVLLTISKLGMVLSPLVRILDDQKRSGNATAKTRIFTVLGQKTTQSASVPGWLLSRS